ncbi:MAG: ABC transporter ATP-binding protein [Candidatus Lokiarchaeota archaeon]|nr:ABC transporter ATP-binding protein [Candidatus Lokiarchaeota archaeon]
MTISENLPLVIMKNVKYEYSNGTVALQGVNLNVVKGELIAIMGKNGAGKTTLIRTLNGLIKPTEGDVFLNGENSRNKSIAELSNIVGLVFQNPHHQLFSNSVEEEIRFSLKNSKFRKEEIESRVEETLSQFTLNKYKNRSPLTLSGGETKKLAIASILCRDPELLVFDEPTLGQDRREISFFVKVVKEEINKGKTVIIVTHNVEFAMEYIPRTILMTNGKILADGPTHEILVKSFLADKSSLVLPQVFQFILALNTNGISCSTEIKTKDEMILFLSKYIKENLRFKKRRFEYR